MGQRDRTIKGGWRHGITGIENADSENISVFYKDIKAEKDRIKNHKEGINDHRL